MDFETMRLLYTEFFTPARVCMCTKEHPYPQTQDQGDGPAVCGAHLWLEKRQLCQAQFATLVNRWLPSQAIAEGWIKERARNRTWFTERGIYKYILDANPFEMEAIYEEKNIGGNARLLARSGMRAAYSIACTRIDKQSRPPIHRGEHPVFLATRSDLIGLMYKDADAWKRTLRYAPFVVIVDSNDGRASLETVLSPAYGREYGVILVYGGQM